MVNTFNRIKSLKDDKIITFAKYGAVAGKVFESEVVKQCLDFNEKEVNESLRKLEELSLIERVNGEYMFLHDSYQEEITNKIPKIPLITVITFIYYLPFLC